MLLAAGVGCACLSNAYGKAVTGSNVRRGGVGEDRDQTINRKLIARVSLLVLTCDLLWNCTLGEWMSSDAINKRFVVV